MVPVLRPLAPVSIGTYFEPFIGGGALFFALIADPGRRPERSVLSDLNAELVQTYKAVQGSLSRLVKRLGELEAEYLSLDEAGREAMYYRMRASRPRTGVKVAARVIFLNKTCFNGLYRVNKQGEFNVPHGRYKTPRICDRETLAAASKALRGVEVRHADFEAACAEAKRGDFVYFDPPFHPLSATSSFTAYTGADFGEAEQIRLKRCVDDLTRRGVAVLVSNSPHPWIRGGWEFAGYRVEVVSARRAINSKGDRRGPIGELVITNDVGA